MDRMVSVISRFHTKHLNSLEDSAHDTLPYYLINAFLFGEDSADCQGKLRSVFNAKVPSSRPAALLLTLAQPPQAEMWT